MTLDICIPLVLSPFGHLPSRPPPWWRYLCHVYALMLSACGQGGLLVRLMKAQDLPPADNNGKSDPYVIFKIDGREQRSTIKPQCLEATWDEKFEWMKVICLWFFVWLAAASGICEQHVPYKCVWKPVADL